MFDEPEQWNVHLFCEAVQGTSKYVGGSSYRNWYPCIYHEGVLIGYRNHAWLVLFASDPTAECIRASCQNPVVDGDPRPRLLGGAVWVRHLPEEAIPYARKAFDEAVCIVQRAIMSLRDKKEEQRREKEAERRKKQEDIVRAWIIEEA